jgi:hypothetical protein
MSTATTAAINFYPTGNGSVLLLEQIYQIVDDRVEVRQPNMTIRGLSHGSVLRFSYSSVPPTNFGVTQGFIAAWPSDFVHLVTPGTTLLNVKFLNFKAIGAAEVVRTDGTQGVQFENCDESIVDGVFVEDFGAENILIGADSTCGKITVNGNKTSGGGNVVNPAGCELCIITNNNFKDTSFQGAEIANGSLIVTNNKFENTGGIVFANDESNAAIEAVGVLITDNIFIQCGHIQVTSQTGSQATGVTFNNNVVHRSRNLGPLNFAVILAGGTQTDSFNQCSNNLITEPENMGGIGVLIGGDFDISGNTIWEGDTGTLTTGINSDVNGIAHIHDNTIFGATTPINASTNYCVGLNYIDGIATSGIEIFTPTAAAGRTALILDDAVVTIADENFFDAASGVAILMITARSTMATTGSTLISSFAAHVSGTVGHHTTVSSVGSFATIDSSTTTLTGTTGTDGNITVSVNDNAGTWQIQVENRSAVTIQVGWQVLGYSS